jgi:hypothetical protein
MSGKLIVIVPIGDSISYDAASSEEEGVFCKGAMKSSPLDDMVNIWNIAGIIDHQLKGSKLFNCFFI